MLSFNVLFEICELKYTGDCGKKDISPTTRPEVGERMLARMKRVQHAFVTNESEKFHNEKCRA
jgi:hypothetical protein